jgi:hypothetical protein
VLRKLGGRGRRWMEGATLQHVTCFGLTQAIFFFRPPLSPLPLADSHSYFLRQRMTRHCRGLIGDAFRAHGNVSVSSSDERRWWKVGVIYFVPPTYDGEVHCSERNAQFFLRGVLDGTLL